MRLIDADKLKKSVLDLQDCYNGFSDTYDKACIIGVIDEQPTVQPELGGYPVEYLLFVARLMTSANVTPEVMASTIKDVEKMARMVIEMARKQVEEAIIKAIINGEGVTE